MFLLELSTVLLSKTCEALTLFLKMTQQRVPKHSMKAFAAYIDITERDLHRLCCPECYEERMMISDYDYGQCITLIHETIKDLRAVDKSPADIHRIVKGKLYEYMDLSIDGVKRHIHCR